MTTSNRIKRLRKEAKISQVELAKKLGTTKQTIYKYENGIITNIPSDKIELMAMLFNTTPMYLMGWENLSETTEMDLDQEVLDFLKENQDVMVGFTTLKDAELPPEQKAAVIASMVAHVKALKNMNNQ